MTHTIERDTFGIPHVRADSHEELAYAQGVAVARDRAFQIVVERLRAEGATAAVFGPDSLSWDVFARRARIDDTARRCFDNLDDSTKAWLGAHVAGVNDHLASGSASAPEFEQLSLRPGRFRPWSPLAIWWSTHLLFSGLGNKLWREELAQDLGEAHIHLFATDGATSIGSNGWLVAGSRSASGLPILAGDPHRFIEAPGVYQQVHLVCPEYDVFGFAVPGVPGVAHFAHAKDVAWSITHAMADTQDLYDERLRRTVDGVEAEGPTGYRRAEVRAERIEVRDGASVLLEVVETERGPVIVGGPDEACAISLRDPVRVHAQLGFDAIPALLRAKSVRDIDAALDAWVTPVNVVQAADRGGGLLHRVAGWVPQRDLRNRERIVPAWDARYAWREGRAPMPRSEDNELAVMANERALSHAFGVEFAAPHRARRIRALLEGRDQWSAADMRAIHVDTFLASADELLSLLPPLRELTAPAERLRARLLVWDRWMDGESVDAAHFAELRAQCARELAAHPFFARIADDRARMAKYPAVLHPWLHFGVRLGYGLLSILASDALSREEQCALVKRALETCAAGEEPAPWAVLHRLAPWQAVNTREAWPGLAGDHDCVLSTTSIPGVTHHSARGPAARFVWDLARREDSGWVVPLGASGIGTDAHARDQLPLWLAGELAPVACIPGELTFERAGAWAPSPTAMTLVVRRVNPLSDLDLLCAWVRDERARFWGMREYARDTIREIYEYLDASPTHHAYLVHRGDEAVALLQTYEPTADPIGACYEVLPGDLGVHLFLAPALGDREPNHTGRLTAALLEYLFLDAEVQRLVAEPDVANAAAVARALLCGFELAHEISLPDKRAQLAFLTRARFEARPRKPSSA